MKILNFLLPRPRFAALAAVVLAAILTVAYGGKASDNGVDDRVDGRNKMIDAQERERLIRILDVVFNAVEGVVLFPEGGANFTVEQLGQKLVVSWPAQNINRQGRPVAGPDFYARVVVDLQSEAVEEFLVGS